MKSEIVVPLELSHPIGKEEGPSTQVIRTGPEFVSFGHAYFDNFKRKKGGGFAKGCATMDNR